MMIIDFDAAKVNDFGKDSREAMAFLMDQINNGFDQRDRVQPDFVWEGKECSISAKGLNSVLRSLEAIDLNEFIMVFPSFRGYSREPSYVIKPFAFHSRS